MKNDDVALLNDEVEEQIKRATLLYEYAKSQYDNYLNRLQLLEEKGIKVFGSISIVVTALVLIVRYGANLVMQSLHLHFFLSIAIIVSGGLTFVGLCSCWSFVFRSVVLIDKPKMPVQDIEAVFLSNTRPDALFSMSNLYMQACQKIEEIHDEKAFLIGKSFQEMQFTGWCFITFVILIAYLKMG